MGYDFDDVNIMKLIVSIIISLVAKLNITEAERINGKLFRKQDFVVHFFAHTFFFGFFQRLLIFSNLNLINFIKFTFYIFKITKIEKKYS